MKCRAASIALFCMFLSAGRGWCQFMLLMGGITDGPASVSGGGFVLTYLPGLDFIGKLSEAAGMEEGADTWNRASNEARGRDDSTGQAVKIPRATFLESAHPHPVRQATVINYGLSSPGSARMSVYNINGQKVRSLLEAHMEAGYHQVRWDGRDDADRKVAAGTYIYRLEAGAKTCTRRLVVVR